MFAKKMKSLTGVAFGLHIKCLNFPPQDENTRAQEGCVQENFDSETDERENPRKGGCGSAGHECRNDERWSGAKFEWPEWSLLGLAQ